jgi:hypothetical protein
VSGILSVIVAVLSQFVQPRNAARIGIDALVAIGTVLLAVLWAMAAMGCAVAALWQFLDARVGPVDALLLVALLLFVAALSLCAIGILIMRQGAKLSATTAPVSAIKQLALPIAELGQLLSKPTVPTLLAAAVLGFILSSASKPPTE